MLTIIQSIILGLIQGITEFIPVSSSAHLAIIEKFWGIQVPVAFNMVLHVATLIAILIVFWKDIINIIKEFDSIPQVFADPDQMQQVFVNIILNAIQAMPNGGTLTIKTRYKDKVEIAFTDTGFGIRKEDMSKLFTPFFTTKGKGKGVGLGLAVCYGIVQHHNGEINVESEEGKGTTFTIRLNTHHN